MMRSWTCCNGSNPLGSLSSAPALREDPGGCESADHPKIARTAEGGACSNYLFGSGFASLGYCQHNRRRAEKGRSCWNLGYQSAIDDKLSQPVYRWEPTRCGEFDNAFPMRDKEHISINHQGVGILLGD